ACKRAGERDLEAPLSCSFVVRNYCAITSFRCYMPQLVRVHYDIHTLHETIANIKHSYIMQLSVCMHDHARLTVYRNPIQRQLAGKFGMEAKQEAQRH